MQKIIDSHFHIWRPKDQPWLSGPSQPRIFGEYDAIKRDYLIDEYVDDRAGTGVEKAVYVQTNWPKEHFEDEVIWLTDVAKESGWPHGIVAYADMTVDDVRPQLDRLKKYPLVRGVRMQLHWHEVERYRFAPSADQVVDPKVRANVGRLQYYGYSFDLQIFPEQMREGAQLVGENPQIDFIVTHTGMLIDLEPETTRKWRSGLQHFAGLPNIHAKLSGLGTFVHRNEPAIVSYIVDNAVDILGSDRLMFGSNFPIEKLWTTYPELVATHRRAVEKHGEAAARNIFWNTAARVYRV